MRADLSGKVTVGGSERLTMGVAESAAAERRSQGAVLM